MPNARIFPKPQPSRTVRVPLGETNMLAVEGGSQLPGSTTMSYGGTFTDRTSNVAVYGGAVAEAKEGGGERERDKKRESEIESEGRAQDVFF